MKVSDAFFSMLQVIAMGFYIVLGVLFIGASFFIPIRLWVYRSLEREPLNFIYFGVGLVVYAIVMFFLFGWIHRKKYYTFRFQGGKALVVEPLIEDCIRKMWVFSNPEKLKVVIHSKNCIEIISLDPVFLDRDKESEIKLKLHAALFHQLGFRGDILLTFPA